MLVGIIGLGGIAQKAYLPILTSMEGTDLALCSRFEQTVVRHQKQYRISAGVTSLPDLIQLGIQAAFVLSPSSTHEPIARELLEHGIDVFLEKPATLRSEDTRSLAELAERRKRVLMVGFNRRYAPLHVAARKLWQDAPIGLALFQKHRPSPFHPDLERHFTDDTIHQIDMLRFFCGEGEVVSTVQSTSPGLLLGAATTVALERGGYGMVMTYLQAGRWQETYSLHGAGRSMIVEAFARLHMINPQEEVVQEVPYASAWLTTLEARGFNREIQLFLECVTQRSEPPTSGWDALKTQLLLEKMVASLSHSKVEESH
ncbi:MAG TPA: Gfo/Idh/MocA family oxidoreductase [Anaerolineales bacterium]|nr:Gfo/Idh/MocA family oxidoreductase [Anaerolineales bacterium]